MNNSSEDIYSQNAIGSPPQQLPHIPIVTSVSCCLILSIIYVASLYIWSSQHNRDHPATVKRRFFSVFIVMLIAPLFVYKFSSPALLERASFAELLGLRWQRLFTAILIPYLLTMLLFLGPLCVQMQNESLKTYVDPAFWLDSFQNILWIRNHVMAPLSEEFVFRACMMPLILQSFSPLTSVFITPLFFGTAHIHHIGERLSLGMELKTAIVISCFQLTYTTIFGFYSSFLFARTGHFIAPFLVHAFCNHMGLPDVQDLWQQHLVRRIIFIICYFAGLIGWIILLPIATQPSLYSNNLYWNN
ncbi:CAAX prenyl protease 2 [Eurosta solidaginis]|uniref:CAAX prenyl protease 2 n=1 Tax=Eurosta solidaginis TaxID=178769 RepID=UPI003530F353